MQIHGPNNESQVRADSAVSRRTVGSPHVGAENTVQHESETKASAVHVKSPQIVALLEQLREHPEVRDERVSEVAARLASGEYFTRDAARQTAARIIDGS